MSTRTRKAGDPIDYRDVTRTAFILAGLFWLVLLYPVHFDGVMGEKRRVLGEQPGGLSYDL